MILLKLTSRSTSFKNLGTLLWLRNLLLWNYANFIVGSSVNNENGNIASGAFFHCVVIPLKGYIFRQFLLWNEIPATQICIRK